MRLSRGLVPSLAIGSVLLLGACGGGGDSTPSPSTAGSGSAAATSPAASSPAASPQETTDASASEGAACLKGAWTVDTTALKKMVEELLSTQQLQATLKAKIDITGESWATIDDSSITTEYKDQHTTITMSMGAQELVTDSISNGKTTASYTVKGDKLVISDFKTKDLKSKTTTKVDGKDMPMPTSSGSLGTETLAMAGGTSTFTCSGDTLTIKPEVPEALATTGTDFSQVLHRRK